MPVKLIDLLYMMGDLYIVILEKESKNVLHCGFVSDLVMNQKRFKLLENYNVFHICKEEWKGDYYPEDLIIVVEEAI